MSSQYVLLVRDTTPDVYESMSAEQRRDLLNRWNGWCDEMATGDRLQSAAPLDNGGRIVAGARGERVLDGPFSEAKEMVGGFFLLTADGMDEVTAIAQRCPLLSYGMTVEIRPVIEACHLATSLGMNTMREEEAA